MNREAMTEEQRAAHRTMFDLVVAEVIRLEMEFYEAEYEEAMLRAEMNAKRRKVERMRHVVGLCEWADRAQAKIKRDGEGKEEPEKPAAQPAAGDEGETQPLAPAGGE